MDPARPVALGAALLRQRLPAALLPVLLLGVAPAQAETPSLLSGAEVVVVSGLPGDVETEAAYEGEMRRLLEAFSPPEARPRRVHLLTDAPDRIAVPPGLEGRVLASSRAQLRNVAASLAGRTAPLVLIAWGHGGVQGETPVFHVRGPRITAEDVEAFAGTAPASFILYFRGSGTFARVLRGPGRAILSSEHEVAFRSDPAGFPLLVGVLRESPGIAFDALAERVGRATAAWYEGQHLARTEEPTLWTGTDAPLTLVSVAAPTASAAPAVSAAAAIPQSPPSPPPAAPSPAAPSSAAWAEIRPRAPESHAGASAVVLLRRTRHVIGDQPALSQEVDEFVQILTAEGERRGDVDVAYSPPEERITFLDVEVRRADGTLQRVDLSTIGDAASQTMGDYRTPARKVFSLPGVAPGAILRMHYRTEWQHFPLPSVILELPLVEGIPVARHDIEIRVGTRVALHATVSGLAAAAPETVATPHGTTYRWRFRDLDPAPPESLAVPGAPRLLVSTFADWPTFASWYERLIRQADQVTPEIEAKAAELTRGLATPRAKAVALYNYVASLRYVAIPLGVNSHRPHAAAQVLKNRYGDCKDKANLLNTLLRTQGIDAHLVLVPRFTEAFDETPGVGFNHALSRIRLDGQPVWVDPTDELARFGLLPPGDAGRKVLVVEAGAHGLVRLPAPRAADHALALRTRLRAAEGSWTVDLEGQARGYADYALRQAARAAAGEIATRPVVGELLRPAAGALGLLRQTHTPPLGLDDAFSWRAEGAMAGLESSLPGGARLLRAPFWLPREWDAAVHPRRSGLFVHDGYPLSLDQTVDVELPTGARDVTLPEPVEETQGPLRFRSAWTREGAGGVRARLEIEAVSGEMGPAEARVFQDALRRLLAAVAQGATYVAPAARRSSR